MKFEEWYYHFNLRMGKGKCIHMGSGVRRSDVQAEAFA
jgi:hypothetical protein